MEAMVIAGICTKRFGMVLVFLLLSLSLLSCSGGGGSGSGIPELEPPAPNSAKAITAFSFTSSNNPGLPANATGVISGTNIAVTLPYGVSRTSLIATFTATGDSVRIGATQQTSGITAYNFSNPVTYTVVAEDNTEENYVVTVTNAPNNAKDITAFAFMDANNGALSQDVVGTISGTNIYATVPNGTSRSALVATFSTTGQSVRVGSTVQVSGTTANNFTDAVIYRVTAQDASTKDYTVTVSESPAATGAIVADHLAAAAFDSIPVVYINAAKANLHIAYGHTSHGSQLITGMNALAAANSLYAWNNGGTGGALDLHDNAMDGDVGYYPDWVNNTRSYLGTVNASGRGSKNPDVNVIIWSWCGQVSNQTQQTMIDQYLAPMTQLESEYWGGPVCLYDRPSRRRRCDRQSESSQSADS